jgi:hypothetical protein
MKLVDIVDIVEIVEIDGNSQNNILQPYFKIFQLYFNFISFNLN